MDDGLFRAAHSHASHHRAELKKSSAAACFHCEVTFPASAIDSWIDETDTALCPVCGIDSVLGDASGLPIAETQFMSGMHRFWFDRIATE